MSPATVDLEVGASQALTVTATYNNATTGPVTADSTFASSDPTVATVDAAGIVTGVAEGKATITARHTATGKTSTAAVSVTAPIVSGFPPITFDTPGIAYTLTGFGGAEDSTLAPDPVGGSNMVAKVVKSATAELWAGTTVSTKANSAVPRIPFTATETKMTVRVYSPKAGIVVRLKVEDAADPTRSVETEAATTKANAWETLTFDFAKPVAGTAPLNLAYTYNKISIFFAFGTTGAAGGAGTYYFDDVTFVSGSSGNTGTCAAPNCTDFSAAGIGFGVFENPGGGTVELAKDPKDAANDVVKFVKKTGDNEYFGTTITGLAGPATLTATDKTVTLRVFSPAVGHQLPAQAGRRPGRRGGGEGRRHDGGGRLGNPVVRPVGRRGRHLRHGRDLPERPQQGHRRQDHVHRRTAVPGGRRRRRGLGQHRDVHRHRLRRLLGGRHRVRAVREPGRRHGGAGEGSERCRATTS